MRVNEIVEIAKGVLIQAPSIAMFSRIICDAGQIQRGDLFIALNPSHIEQAILNGAYGIICEREIPISDKEVAYILVENMQDCLVRLVRYRLLVQDIAFISALSPIEQAIAKNIIDDERVCFFNGDISAFCELLNQPLHFIITNNTQIMELGFNTIQVNKPKERPFLTLSYTLFDSTILYKDMHYRINLPKLFFNELSTILHFCEQEGLSCHLGNFKYIPFFKPNFLNAFGKVIEYGQASKVAIAEEDIEQFKRYMAYIANNAAWGKTLFLVPKMYVELFSQIAQTFAYNSQEELCSYIHRENFNFALILGINDDTLINALNTNHRQILEPDLFSGMWNEEQQL
ncbi:hypothetical protein [Helicobacter marmotae]|uniref:Ferrochelatase n=1 Tax=Helicobacter marmotae TaxID=152490 RepID=A0A3D8I351_9HELI|nr:hypothetical protein [Helicobacter marmotae]RDU59538.1 hypothetical protein CQA63_06430 [Helicobacter marmotae]